MNGIFQVRAAGDTAPVKRAEIISDARKLLKTVLLDNTLVPFDLDADLAGEVEPGQRVRPPLGGVVEQRVDLDAG